MTLDELIAIADAAYTADFPGGMIDAYHRDPEGKHGDGLAKFIARELRETFNEVEVNDTSHLRTAIHALENANDELRDVIHALKERFYILSK